MDQDLIERLMRLAKSWNAEARDIVRPRPRDEITMTSEAEDSATAEAFQECADQLKSALKKWGEKWT